MKGSVVFTGNWWANHQPVMPARLVRHFIKAGVCFACLQAAVMPGYSQGAQFWADTSILKITLEGPVRRLLADRGDNPAYHTLKFGYTSAAGAATAFTLKARCRGNFRRERENCNFPPILLNFPKNDTVKASLFKGANKLKLVMPCRRGDFVAREYLIYKMYNLLTPYSFKVRLAELVLKGPGLRSAEEEPMLCFLIEEETDLAKRAGGKIVDSIRYQPSATHFSNFATMAIFQFMIANVDWSLPYRHNIRTIMPKGSPQVIPVPYDFDHAGLVFAPYAQPPEALEMQSVQERKFRGACLSSMQPYAEALEGFKANQEAFYTLYRQCSYIGEGYRRQALKFLDEFFAIIAVPKRWEAAFYEACRTGTQIQVGGLKMGKEQ